jgi:hypothetical protein
MSESEQGGLHSILEVLDRFLSKPLPEKWGKWKLDRARRVIYYDGPHDYWFSLAQMNNSTEVLDWIVHLHEEKWATPADIGNLVAALDDIFDLQNNLCGCGIEHRFNAQEHLAKLFPAPAKGEPPRVS